MVLEFTEFLSEIEENIKGGKGGTCSDDNDIRNFKMSHLVFGG